MHKNATKCNETLSKWCRNKHGASKIIDTLETYQGGIPKFIIDWLMILVSLVLKLFVSSRPLKLEGVLCIYVLLSMKDKLKTICMFFLMIWTHVDFHCFIFMIFRLCSFSCYNMVAKFLLSRLCLSCPCFKFFWSQLTTLTYMIKIV